MTSPLQPKNPLLPSEIDLHVPVSLLSFTLPANLREDYQKSVALIDEFVENYSGRDERNDLLLKICDHVAQLGKLYSTQQFLTILGNAGEYLRILLLSSDFHQVYCSLIIQDGLVKNGDYRVHTVIGRYMNMKTLSKISRRRQLGKTKEETALGYFIADVIQAWGEAFEPRSALYPYIPETYHRLKFKHSCLFLRPDYDPTRVPIFLPEMTRQQMEEVEYLNRSTSRTAVSSEHKGTFATPAMTSSAEKDHWSSSPGSTESNAKPAKPPLPRQRSSMSPPGKPPKPPTPVRSASLSSRRAEEVDLLNSPWPDDWSTQLPVAPVTTPESQPSVYDERSVQHVLSVFSSPTPTSQPALPSSELSPWTPLQDSHRKGGGLSAVSPARPADAAFDLMGDFKPQSMHSLLERYVSDTALSSPLAQRSDNAYQSDALPREDLLALSSFVEYHQQSVASGGEHDELPAAESCDSTKDFAPDMPEKEFISPSHQEADDSIAVVHYNSNAGDSEGLRKEVISSVNVSDESDLLPPENFSTEITSSDAPQNEKKDDILEEADTSEAVGAVPEQESTLTSTSSATPRRLSKSTPGSEEPSELEKAFALRHIRETADLAPFSESASSEGDQYDRSKSAVPPAKPKRETKKESHDPASDKNVEFKFYGNQRVLVRKSSAGAIPKYF